VADTPISKTQERVTGLLGIETDGTYSHAARLLQAAGLPGDGVPDGHTWRTVKKLSDADLLALLRPDPERALMAGSDTRPTAETRPPRQSWYQRAKEFRRQVEANKAAGLVWDPEERAWRDPVEVRLEDEFGIYRISGSAVVPAEE